MIREGTSPSTYCCQLEPYIKVSRHMSNIKRLTHCKGPPDPGDDEPMHAWLHLSDDLHWNALTAGLCRSVGPSVRDEPAAGLVRQLHENI